MCARMVKINSRISVTSRPRWQASCSFVARKASSVCARIRSMTASACVKSNLPLRNARTAPSCLQYLVQILEKAPVLVGGAHTYTNPCRQLVLIHGAYDHPASKKLLE